MSCYEEMSPLDLGPPAFSFPQQEVPYYNADFPSFECFESMDYLESLETYKICIEKSLEPKKELVSIIEKSSEEINIVQKKRKIEEVPNCVIQKAKLSQGEEPFVLKDTSPLNVHHKTSLSGLINVYQLWFGALIRNQRCFYYCYEMGTCKKEKATIPCCPDLTGVIKGINFDSSPTRSLFLCIESPPNSGCVYSATAMVGKWQNIHAKRFLHQATKSKVYVHTYRCIGLQGLDDATSSTLCLSSIVPSPGTFVKNDLRFLQSWANKTSELLQSPLPVC